MDAAPATLVAAVAVVLAVVASVPVLLRLLSASAGGKKTNPKAPLPPGSFGLPFIGQTLSLLRALRANTADDWLRRCVATYGPVSRLRLFGCPTAFLVGTSANKFIFASAAVTAKAPESFARMVGRRTIRDVVGDEHRRVRAMMVQFLRVDAVKRHVASMDGEVRRHLDAEWRGRGTVAVMPSMKSLTFDVMCTAIFGLGTGAVRRELWTEFQELVRGIWEVPVDLPFTTYSRCLAASQRGRRAVAGVIQERRTKLERGESSPASDVVTLMLAEGLPDEEIIDNVMFLMVAAHDTTAALLTFLIRQLDADKDAYDKVVQEQEEIARSKAAGEALTWEDLGRMRYTWAAALETLRMVPPVFTMMRKTVDDVEYGGYLIPKGWQVIHAANMTQWDPAIFPEPGRFDPARFENASAVPPFAFVPFGGGARVCPGNEFARVETLVAMHHIVTRFRWKLAAGCDRSFSRFPLPYPSQGLLIDIEPIQK
ncbi:cytochrome P450 716B1 [Sorghum bicolor]|uniref:Cytochrome P450 716B1 n=1 Tax=Sorghum bicolor TaxID=4558 RepID=C5Z8P9_SORBI|nr:cytochrome P450 716B1 [Sorghum bicolor]EER88867.1 hypothetical protein SORBI_3010G242100 [Sorghum bicolor]BBH36858.1 cytochrome P450 [Sorghum bicolor]|eukprot:XP_002437500.1 cytochrome P450 716B1 [Sorghum bicolor]